MNEADLTKAVLDLASLLGYRTAHFRPAQNSRGAWRTPVAGDGKGFPDLVLAGRGRVVFAELKVGRNGLSDEQVEWRSRILLNRGEWFLFTDKDWHSGAIEAELRRER